MLIIAMSTNCALHSHAVVSYMYTRVTVQLLSCAVDNTVSRFADIKHNASL